MACGDGWRHVGLCNRLIVAASAFIPNVLHHPEGSSRGTYSFISVSWREEESIVSGLDR